MEATGCDYKSSPRTGMYIFNLFVKDLALHEAMGAIDVTGTCLQYSVVWYPVEEGRELRRLLCVKKKVYRGR